jgi:hypothetical protein
MPTPIITITIKGPEGVAIRLGPGMVGIGRVSRYAPVDKGLHASNHRCGEEGCGVEPCSSASSYCGMGSDSCFEGPVLEQLRREIGQLQKAGHAHRFSPSDIDKLFNHASG